MPKLLSLVLPLLLVSTLAAQSVTLDECSDRVRAIAARCAIQTQQQFEGGCTAVKALRAAGKRGQASVLANIFCTRIEQHTTKCQEEIKLVCNRCVTQLSAHDSVRLRKLCSFLVRATGDRALDLCSKLRKCARGVKF